MSWAEMNYLTPSFMVQRMMDVQHVLTVSAGEICRSLWERTEKLKLMDVFPLIE